MTFYFSNHILNFLLNLKIFIKSKIRNQIITSWYPSYKFNLKIILLNTGYFLIDFIKLKIIIKINKKKNENLT